MPSSEWQRALVTLTATVVTVAVVAVLFWARSVFIPIALAIFLTFVLSPVVARLQRRGLGRVPAVLLTSALVVAAVGGVGAVVVSQVSRLADTLPDRAEAIKAKVVAAKVWVVGDGDSRFGRLVDDVSNAISPPRAAPQRVVVEQDGMLGAQAAGYISPAAEFLGQAAFALVLTLFMLLKREDLRNRMIRVLGDGKVTTTTKAVDDASKRISRYLLMQLLINTAFGLLIALSMFVIGVPYALLWGFVAAVMRYIPYLGTWLGLFPPVVMTLAFTHGGWEPFAVLGVYAVLELICNNYVEPKLYGSSMGLSEVAQLVAAAFWAFLWGPVGLILSGPLTVCLLVLGKYVPWLQFLDVLLGDEPALSADVRFYQRMTARDQDEASEIAHEELAAESTVAVFDTVIVPALSYAKRDAERNDHTPEEFAGMLGIAREIVDDLADREQVRVADSTELDPLTEKVRVLAVPARDAADEVGVEMLRSLMNPQLWEVEVSPVAHLTSEVITRAVEFDPAVIVIGSLPPGGLAHTRYVCKRIARQFPKARVVVGRWGETGDTAENRTQLADAGAAHVTTSLEETATHLTSWMGALENKQKAADKAQESPAFGTATAKTLVV